MGIIELFWKTERRGSVRKLLGSSEVLFEFNTADMLALWKFISINGVEEKPCKLIFHSRSAEFIMNGGSFELL